MKNKQIEKIQDILPNIEVIRCMYGDTDFATYLYDHGCRQIEDNSIVMTKSEKEKLLHEIYEQGRFDALADLEKEGKVVLSIEELEDMVNAKMKCINDMAIITQKKTAESLLSELYYIARFYYGDSANVLAWAKEKAEKLGVEIKE